MNEEDDMTLACELRALLDKLYPRPPGPYITELLGKPLEYWYNLDCSIKSKGMSEVIDENLDLRVSLERCEMELAQYKNVWAQIDQMGTG